MNGGSATAGADDVVGVEFAGAAVVGGEGEVVGTVIGGSSVVGLPVGTVGAIGVLAAVVDGMGPGGLEVVLDVLLDVLLDVTVIDGAPVVTGVVGVGTSG